MENDILDSLNDLGYEGPLLDEVTFTKALDGGPKSLEYTKLIHILAEELKKLCQLEETVNMMNDPDDSSHFLLELSSFLKELGCPYKNLVTGHMSSRLQTKEDRVLLLDYLISELMAARMVQVDKPKEKTASTMDIVMHESPTAKDLKDILISLKFNKPPPNITPEVLFSKLEAKLKDNIQKEGDQLVGKPLYNKALAEKDWKQLETNFNEMFEEYRLRRETLITRLECTVQSFEWSDRLKTKKDIIQSAYRPKRDQLKVKPDVRLADFLAARSSLLQVEKTSNANVRKNTHSDVNKVIIGQVPDRGGRPNEQQPPPPEMPSWQQRAPGGQGSTKRAVFMENRKLIGRRQPMDNLQYQTGIPGGSQSRSITVGQTKKIPLLSTPITSLQPNQKDLSSSLNSYGTPINEPKAGPSNETFMEEITDKDDRRWLTRYNAFIARQLKKRLANKRNEAPLDALSGLDLGVTVEAKFETQNPPVVESQHPVTLARLSPDIKSLKRALSEEESSSNQAKKTFKSEELMSAAPKTTYIKPSVVKTKEVAKSSKVFTPIRVEIRNKEPMSHEQLGLVRKGILQAIIDDPEKKGPAFAGCTFKTGWLQIDLKNASSLKWMEQRIGNIKPWPEAQLSLVNSQLSKTKVGVVYVPNSEAKFINDALVLLHKQNDLNTRKWKVLNCRTEKNGIIIVLSIDSASIEDLRKLDFKPRLGFKRVLIRIRGRDKKNRAETKNLHMKASSSRATAKR